MKDNLQKSIKEMEDKYKSQLSSEESNIRDKYALSSDTFNPNSSSHNNDNKDHSISNSKLNDELKKLNSVLRDKEQDIEDLRSQLHVTKDRFEVVRTENNKLKDTLNETNNELLLVKDKSKNVKSFNSTIENDNTLHFTNNINNLNQSYEEISNLRNEVSFLKNKVHKLENTKVNTSQDDYDTLSRDLLTIKEYKDNVAKEKAKTEKIYKILTNDNEQFKKDYAELKTMQPGTNEYESRRQSLKKIKKVLDEKIANINYCVSVIIKTEGFLANHELELQKRIKEVNEGSEYSIMEERNDLDVEGEEVYDIDYENIRQPDLREKYSHLKDVGEFREKAEEIRMIDREIKQRIKSSYSNKILQKHKTQKTVDYNTKMRTS